MANLGGNNAKLIQYDVNFAEIRELMLQNDWSEIGYRIAKVAGSLTSIGAKYVAVASNTIHKVAPTIAMRVGKKNFIHIGDCIGKCCCAQIQTMREHWPEYYTAGEPKRVLLLGTMETMTGDFLKNYLEKYGLVVETPNESDMRMLDECIFQKLCAGDVTEAIRKWYLGMLRNHLSDHLVDAIILGCTELALLYNEFHLSHHRDLLELYDGRPFAVTDSKEAHIWGITQACLGQWEMTED